MPLLSSWRLRSGASLIAALAAAAFVAGPAQAKPPVITTGASVVGSGTAGNGSFDINAHAQPGGSTASGYADFDLAIGHIDGQVTCTRVSNGLAGISGTLGPETTAVDPSSTQGFYLYIAEGTPDSLQLVLAGFVPPAGDCSPQQPVSPAAVTSGDIQLTAPSTICIKKPKKC